MAAGPRPVPAGLSQRQTVFVRINEATKWAVTAVVAVVLLWRHDVHSMWSVVGCVNSSFICKVKIASIVPAHAWHAQLHEDFAWQTTFLLQEHGTTLGGKLMVFLCNRL